MTESETTMLDERPPPYARRELVVPATVSPVAEAVYDEDHGPPQVIDDDAELLARLAAFESVGARLWPFVRYFALAGGHPDAIAAVADLALLLGKDEHGPAAATEAAMKARCETIDGVADWFQRSNYYRLMVPSSRDKFILDLKALKES